MNHPAEIAPERPDDAATIATLVARAFGPGRLAKTAERVRERGQLRTELSFVAREGGEPVGTVRLWSVELGGRDLLFLGPIAVDAGRRGSGTGGRLVEAACAAADAAGAQAIVLVGDLPFFGPLGFRVAEGVRLPGPVDPARVLIRGKA